MTTAFISDLHLDSSRPDATRRFVDFMARDARKAERLYILGDLFEAWIGDDDDDDAIEPVASAIAELTRAGVPCCFMHGNRDFLVGERFADRTGMKLLDEFEVIEVAGGPLLLTHGDLLCTDDTRYLTLRAQLRDPGWQNEFLDKSLGERRAIARELRSLSQTEMASKSEEIMDVNRSAVAETMRRFGVCRLLHGHTHRPGIHRFELDGAAATRVVLDDWYEGGSFVVWDESGPRSVTLRR